MNNEIKVGDKIKVIYLNGQTIQGTVTKIHKNPDSYDFITDEGVENWCFSSQAKKIIETRTKEECIQYLVDYVVCGARFLLEVEDGYVFKCSDEMEGDSVIKVFKSKDILLEEYEVL